MADVGDVIRIACRQEFDATDDIVNVLHWVVGLAPTPDTDASLMADLGAIISNMYDEIGANVSNLVSPVDLQFYNVTADAPIGVTSWPGPYAGGTGSGEALPPHDTAMLLLPTNVKRTVGRIYLPVMTEAAQNQGHWVSGVHTNVDAFATQLLGTIEGDLFGGQYRYAVYKRGAGEYAFPTYARLSDNVAVQTRRKRGRGS